MAESPNNITTAEEIRNLRKELNLTQRELAKMLGVVYATVNRRGYGQTALRRAAAQWADALKAASGEGVINSVIHSAQPVRKSQLPPK